MMRSGSVMCCALLLAACGWMNDGEGLFIDPTDDYLDAQQDGDLSYPGDLAGLGETDPFPIPPTPESQNPRFYPKRPPLPDAIYANDNRDEVRVQRLSDRQWLVIPEGPTTVWPKLKQFLAENGITITHEAPDVGRLNTEWLEISDTSYRDVVRTVLKDAKLENSLMQGRDRYLIRVEQGLRAFTTEVHVRHENDSVALPAEDALVDLNKVTSVLSDAETEAVREIGAYVAAKVSEQVVSRVAQRIGSTQKAELVRDDYGNPMLRLFLDYERVWATLGQSLGNAQVEIVNSDKEGGVYEVKLDESVFGADTRKGFFCRITFSCDKFEAYDLRLRVDDRGAEVFDVSVLLAENGQPLDADVAQQVLVLIREYAG